MLNYIRTIVLPITMMIISGALCAQFEIIEVIPTEIGCDGSVLIAIDEDYGPYELRLIDYDTEIVVESVGNAQGSVEIDDICQGEYALTAIGSDGCDYNVGMISVIKDCQSLIESMSSIEGDILDLMPSEVGSCNGAVSYYLAGNGVDITTINLRDASGMIVESTIYSNPSGLFSNLCGNTPYSISFEVSNGCEFILGEFDIVAQCFVDNIEVIEISPTSVREDPYDISEYEDECTGEISLTDYSALDYSWSNGHSGSTISGLCAGDYKVTITNTANACSIVRSYNVEFNQSCEMISISNVTIEPSSGSGDGSISVDVNSDLRPDINIEWFSQGIKIEAQMNVTTASLSNLFPGLYQLRVYSSCGIKEYEYAVTCSLVDLPIRFTRTMTNSSGIGCSGSEVVTIDLLGMNVNDYLFEWDHGVTGRTVELNGFDRYVLNISNKTTGCTHREYVYPKYIKGVGVGQIIGGCPLLNNSLFVLEINNPLNETIELLINNEDRSNLYYPGQKNVTISGVDVGNVSYKVLIGDCQYSGVVTIQRSPGFQEMYSAVNSERECLYDFYCDGDTEPYLEGVAKGPAIVDVLAASGDGFSECRAPLLCDQKPVGYFSVDKVEVSLIEYREILEYAAGSVWGGLPDYIEDRHRYYQLKGWKGCKRVKYCPLTLKISGGSLTFGDNPRQNIRPENYGNGCEKIYCKWPSPNIEFCIDDIIPFYFDPTFEPSGYPKPPNIGGDCEQIITINAAQIDIWSSSWDNYIGSSLEDEINQVFYYDPQAAGCTMISFCFPSLLFINRESPDVFCGFGIPDYDRSTGEIIGTIEQCAEEYEAGVAGEFGERIKYTCIYREPNCNCYGYTNQWVYPDLAAPSTISDNSDNPSKSIITKGKKETKVMGDIRDSGQLKTSVDILAFPNPFSNEISFELETTIDYELEIQIVSILGTVVVKNIIIPAGEIRITSNALSTYNDGIYFVRTVRNGAVLATKKILKITK